MRQGPRRFRRGPARAYVASLVVLTGHSRVSSAHLRFVADFLPADFFRPPLDFRFDGTFAPFARASDNPIAIACFLLVTLPPLPPRPLRNVPFLRFFIARSTRLLAALPYFRVLFFRVAMSEDPRVAVSGRAWMLEVRPPT
jgi:hypothetical protein